MTTDRVRENRGGIDRATWFVSLSASVVVALVIVVGDALFAWRPVTALAVGVSVAFYAAVTMGVARRLLSVRYYDFRLALTGQPAAGKTVFANLLYDQLMRGGDALYEFTADSKSAIATYQAMRGMAVDEWPPRTVRGSVLQRDGEIRHQRVSVDLEIGDAAGEHWMRLAGTDGEDWEADYLQWVLSAHALAHVVPADRIVDHAEAVFRSDVEDLRLATQLMRSAAGRRYAPVPLLIVISKVDLVAPTVDSELMKIFSAEDAKTLETTRRLASFGGIDIAGILFAVADELSEDFRDVSFVYSSAPAITRQRIGAPRRADVARWIVDNAVSQNRSGDIVARLSGN